MKAWKCHPEKREIFDGYCGFCLTAAMMFVKRGIPIPVDSQWLQAAESAVRNFRGRKSEGVKKSLGQRLHMMGLTAEQRAARTAKARAARWAKKKTGGRWVTIATNRPAPPIQS